MRQKLPKEKAAYMSARITRLRSEIYIILIDELFMDYATAEGMAEGCFFIIGGNKNLETIKKINSKMLQIKNLQLLMKVS
jgi:hypothetical protein